MTVFKKIENSWPYYLASCAILSGIALTVISALKLCTSTCTEAQHYRLFGVPFELIGGIYFGTLLVTHYFAKDRPLFRQLTGLLISLGLGAEIFFILLQKVQIGVWCPLCLGIAFCIGITGIAYLIWNQKEQSEALMQGWLHTGALIGVLTLGFTASFLGVTKIDQLQAAEDEIKDRIKFGNKNSPIEVYVFTDWVCPACRAVEPTIEAMAPKITQQAQLTFVDTVVHPETLNFAPYNIALMAQAKAKYFRLREALNQLSLSNKKPKDEDISKAIAPLGVELHELPYEDVTAALRYFEELAQQYKVTSTPTVAIVNRQDKKEKKLTGAKEITEANVMKAINALR